MIAHSPTPALTLPLRTARALDRPATGPQAIGPRFTPDGSAELETHLARTCEKIAAGIRGLIPAAKLEAILLGGGYGRGEGGVLHTPNGDRPYNDLEFYVAVRGNRHLNERRFGRALHVLGEILTPQAGVEVEFKITSLAELRGRTISMFSYDLVMGHRWLVGRDELLAGCAHHREAGEIPLSEATRLLMNRCTGLLLARERLLRREFTAADADFVGRNLAKAELALGDAVLVPFHHYHWSVRERHRLLERLARSETLPWLNDVVRHHARGVEFKLHPERSTAPRETLQERHAGLTALAAQVFTWLEARRLGFPFGQPAEYVVHPAPKWPDASAGRNIFVNAKALGWRGALGTRALRHPRERVLHALVLLLWAPAALAPPAGLQHVQRELRTEASEFRQLVEAYQALWAQVN